MRRFRSTINGWLWTVHDDGTLSVTDGTTTTSGEGLMTESQLEMDPVMVELEGEAPPSKVRRSRRQSAADKPTSQVEVW